jgi:hypothetical protein
MLQSRIVKMITFQRVSQNFAIFLCTEVAVETDIIARLVSNVIKFHIVCISWISVFLVVLKRRIQTIYITIVSFGHTVLSLFMVYCVHVRRFKYGLQF